MSSAETSKQIKHLLKPLKDERADACRLDELRRLFASHRDDLTLDASGTSSVAVWQQFLKDSFQKFIQQLSKRIRHGRKTAIRCMWGVLATSPAHADCGASLVPTHLLREWIKAMSAFPGDFDRGLQTMVQGEFLHAYVDVRYYSCLAISSVAKSLREANEETDDIGSLELQSEHIFQLLLMIPVPKNVSEIHEGNFLFPPPSDADGDVSEKEDEEADKADETDDSDVESSSDDTDDDDTATRKRKGEEKFLIKRGFKFQQIRSHHKVISEAWFAVLQLKHLPTRALTTALAFLSEEILPVAPEPLKFSDFFLNAFMHHTSGVVPVVALDGLFTLILGHSLELQDYYKHLYGLMGNPSLFYVKHRNKFWNLLAKSLLYNPMLPGHVVASFAKRLLRVTLSAPPPAALFSLALVSNLLRKFPEAMLCLIHRSGGGEIEDVFDAETSDPAKTRALESSLWELHVLEKHYYAPIATMAKSIGKDEDKTPMHNLDDFLSLTYKALFDQERKRKRKVAAPLTFQEPKDGLFGPGDDEFFSSIVVHPR